MEYYGVPIVHLEKGKTYQLANIVNIPWHVMNRELLQRQMDNLYIEPHTLYNIWGTIGRENMFAMVQFIKTDADRIRNTILGRNQGFYQPNYNLITLNSDHLPEHEKTIFIDLEKKEKYDAEQKIKKFLREKVIGPNKSRAYMPPTEGITNTGGILYKASKKKFNSNMARLGNISSSPLSSTKLGGKQRVTRKSRKSLRKKNTRKQ